MSEITVWLRRTRAGDPDALSEVFEHVYPELRRIAAARMAAFKPSATITPTVLVHEACVRLIGSGDTTMWSATTP